MGEKTFNWVEKRLPVLHYIYSGFFITIQIISVMYGILFFVVLPFVFIAIYLLFFNKSSYSILFIEKFLSIKPNLLSRTKLYDLREISSIVITFTKQRDGYLDGTDNKHSYTTSLFYNFKIKGVSFEHTYKFKKKWIVSGLSTPERQVKAVKKRDDFKLKLVSLRNYLPRLVEIHDIAPEPRIICQTKFFLLGFNIFAVLGLYLVYMSGDVKGTISGFIWVLVLTTCIILPGRKYKNKSQMTNSK